MNIVGISAFYHDSAACLVIDGEIAAAAQEERLRDVDGPPLGLLVLFVLSLILGLAVTALLPLLA